MAVIYESTNRTAEKVSFKQALIKGQAPDRGLYTPIETPKISAEELASFKQMRYHEIAYAVAYKYLEDEIPSNKLAEICEISYDFEVPIEHVFEKCHVMRLDRGPTASFKDFAARLMARLMQYFLDKQGSKALILTATSGDTGSAVANAFHNLSNIDVVVLYPRGEVTEMQRRQMTTLGGNIRCISVDGKFDDCQAMVKHAFSDSELEDLYLTSANSINFGRLLPQTVYYFYAYSRVSDKGEDVVFSVPSGNFGDLMGGLLTKKMGLPVEKLLVATNENNEFPRYLETGQYSPIKPSKACISNAMNVGHPSNLARLFHMYGGWMDETGCVRQEPDLEALRRDLWSISVSDQQTREAIKNAYEQYSLLLEPHGAVGWKAATEYRKTGCNRPIICLETADPAKFPDEIVSVLGFEPELPKSLEGLNRLQEEYIEMEGDYEILKKTLRDLF